MLLVVILQLLFVSFYAFFVITAEHEKKPHGLLAVFDSHYSNLMIAKLFANILSNVGRIQNCVSNVYKVDLLYHLQMIPFISLLVSEEMFKCSMIASDIVHFALVVRARKFPYLAKSRGLSASLPVFNYSFLDDLED